MFVYFLMVTVVWIHGFCFLSLFMQLFHAQAIHSVAQFQSLGMEGESGLSFQQALLFDLSVVLAICYKAQKLSDVRLYLMP